MISRVAIAARDVCILKDVCSRCPYHLYGYPRIAKDFNDYADAKFRVDLVLEAKNMSIVIENDISNLMVARRLLEIERNAELRRKGKHVEEKSALGYFEEDKAIISASASSAQNSGANPLPSVENINVNLADLHKTVTDLANASNQGVVSVQANTAEESFTITSSQNVEIKLELRYRSNAPMEGLVVHDRNYAESDRYLYKFSDGETFTILDKWTQKSTTIWGDPHIDVDDTAGNNDGDFKDLKSSDDFTTFMLQDGTRVTFKAKDDGIIEQVDIYKGSQHVKGVGSAAGEFSPETGLFSAKVLDDGASAANKTPVGDVVYAGGDGNDWFDASNKLIWGKTTGAVVTQRPSATLELYYKQTISQSLAIQTISKSV